MPHEKFKKDGHPDKHNPIHLEGLCTSCRHYRPMSDPKLIGYTKNGCPMFKGICPHAKTPIYRIAKKGTEKYFREMEQPRQ